MRKLVKTLPAKWVLLGEHAVVRGKPALCFPCFDYSLTLQVALESDRVSKLEPTLQKVLDSDLMRAFPSFLSTLSSIEVKSSIPESSGLGSSAALCVAFAEVLSDLGYLKGSLVEKMEWARKLENLFHGESSGMDIWAVSSRVPLLFSRGKPPEPLSFAHLPKFTLHDSGIRASTRDCVARVQNLAQTEPDRFKNLDNQMERAVNLATMGLKKYNDGDSVGGLESLKTAMNWGYDCFQHWGLIPEALQTHIQNLRDQGALAVKPTGKGGGGFLVALWS